MEDFDLKEDNIFPNGKVFATWEKNFEFSKTYFVNCNSAKASDNNQGTEEEPFKTIGRAAEVLMPGERVVIKGGVYRECIKPKRGGASPEEIISYEVAPGEEVIVKGSALITDGWEISSGWRLHEWNHEPEEGMKVWKLKLDGKLFDGYNPFAMINVLQDREWLPHKKINMDPFFKRRGLVFVDGKPLEQVEISRKLEEKAGVYWVEHDGRTIHVRLPKDDCPENHEIEITTQEQLFMPEEMYAGYIRVKGIRFMHAANGFPVPQRGALSANRGHHFIFENNVIEWINSLGMDFGNGCWNAEKSDVPGDHIVRGNILRNCGICGMAAFESKNLLIENNLIEYCGWQNAELMYESSGVKVHRAKNMMFKGNIIRHNTYASGIWLDCSNENCRLTGNIFADITTARGAVHFEGTHGENLVDNNIIWRVRAQYFQTGDYGAGGSGLYAEGSDKIVFVNNLVMDCENWGYFSNTIPDRIIDGRGGTARGHKVTENIFHNCRKAAVELANEYNEAEGNIYSRMSGGFLRVSTPEPAKLLNLEAWQEFYGWDKGGKVRNMDLELISESLMLIIDTNNSDTVRIDLRERRSEIVKPILVGEGIE
jgi:hypothetical protein